MGDKGTVGSLGYVVRWVIRGEVGDKGTVGSLGYVVR